MKTMTHAGGLRLVRGADPVALVARAAAELLGAADDPFVAPLVLTPGPGVQRWLSQSLAAAGGPGTEGICAGFDFEPAARLATLLGAPDDRDDPWSPGRLVLHILDLAAGDDPQLRPLSDHLAANDQRYANASRVARLFDRYARYRPDVLDAWSDGGGDDLGFDAWQPHLWRALHTRISAPDPVERAAALRDEVRHGGDPLPWPSAVLFCPRHLTRGDAQLLAALASRLPVTAYVYEPGPDVGAFPLAERLGRRARGVAALLREVAVAEEALTGSVSPPAVDVHSCHGLDRQVEVLREALAGLLADDPSLEPRDIVIATPSVRELAPHISAAFGPSDAGSGWRHPGYGFRVQIAGRSARDANALLPLLEQVTELSHSRGTAGDLLGFCAHPFVARRFGFVPDALERLERLVPEASIRWGVNGAHRGLFGLAGLRQNTWLTGVQRLMMGEALDEDSRATAGVITPVDDVESTDVGLLGAFAELVSRLTRFSTECRTPASAAGWAARFRAMADELVDVPFEDSWQLTQLWSVIERIERRGAGSELELSTADALALLDAEFSTRTARPTFGNGSLIVCGLADLAQVPHRVICLVGLEDRTFPRRFVADGDDLMARSPRPGDPDPGADDRQALLDALGSARDRLVVIFHGRSSLTNEPFPPPSGVVDVLEATGAEVIQEALQPFSPRYFTSPPRSFDQSALAAARALKGERHASPDRYDVGYLPVAPPEAMDLEALCSFLAHPARYFLRQRAQLTLGEEEQPTHSIPIELSGLERWQVGDRVLAEMLRGRPAAEIEHRERLSGELPPAQLGGAALADVMRAAERIARRAEPLLAEEPRHENIDLDVEGIRLTGRLITHGGRIVRPQFSRVRAKHLAEAWVDLLALSAARGSGAEAVSVDNRGAQTLAVPDAATARRHLATIVALAVEGLQTVLPAPARVAEFWALCRRQHRDPHAGYDLRDAWDAESQYDAVWPRFYGRGHEPWSERVTDEPWAQPGEPTKLGSLAALLWDPIVGAQA
ncbi:exodeoxyribonuclease V subunit gamma [Nigerium massiliense]|uniref:exodeoxyribonuclease V subunit gamma n=1 Tax=Nigerium massiliense TaxID=1522317 RepID=UPI00058E6ABA|nr:exodeoxyribonuclease V subunit gamma [Nigerium massiliense]